MFGREDYTTKWKKVGGKLESPSGNLAEKNDRERPNKFKRDGSIAPNPLNMSKPRLLRNDLKIAGDLKGGPNTIGGVVGGMYDQGDYSGVKAGKRRRG